MSTKELVDSSEFMMYSVGETQGVTVLVVISCISLVTVVGLLLTIGVSAFNTRTSLDEHLFVRTHVAAYFVSLLLCNLIQAIASIVNAAWINHTGVYAGDLCVFQGVLKQVSDIGMAVWTLVIAGHTFCLLFLELKMRVFVLWATLIGGWSTIASFVTLGPATMDTEKRGPFFGISGYWCWISPQYKVERITLDYLIMFLAAFISFMLYILIFLKIRGNVVQSGWRIRFHRTNGVNAVDWQGRKFTNNQATNIAKQMLLYPISYIVLVLPIVISRFASWSGHEVPFEITIFSAAIFLMSGLINVILFIATGRVLPAESMKIGRRVIFHPREFPTEDQGSNESQVKAHTRTGSSSSSDSTIVSGSINSKQTRKTKSRPPDIIITRDSIDSFYGAYEEEIPNVQLPALPPSPAASHWSPEGSPENRSWRY